MSRAEDGYQWSMIEKRKRRRCRQQLQPRGARLRPQASRPRGLYLHAPVAARLAAAERSRWSRRSTIDAKEQATLPPQHIALAMKGKSTKKAKEKAQSNRAERTAGPTGTSPWRFAIALVHQERAFVNRSRVKLTRWNGFS